MGPHSKLNGHPNRNSLPGVETNTGPLGHGFPVALGIAMAGQSTGAGYRTYVLIGEGEQQEGSNGEAAMTAGHRELAKLALIVGRNRLQQGAGTVETSALGPLDEKYRAFGREVVEVDRHDIPALLEVLGAPVGSRQKPLCVIANTVKGKADVAYAGFNVQLVDQSPGIAYGVLGATHHCIENFAWLRALGPMTIVAPSDLWKTAEAVKWGRRARAAGLPAHLAHVGAEPAGVGPPPCPRTAPSARAPGATRLPGGLPVLAMMGDRHAALFGHRARGRGPVKATYGTGSSLMTLS